MVKLYDSQLIRHGVLYATQMIHNLERHVLDRISNIKYDSLS